MEKYSRFLAPLFWFGTFISIFSIIFMYAFVWTPDQVTISSDQVIILKDSDSLYLYDSDTCRKENVGVAVCRMEEDKKRSYFLFVGKKPTSKNLMVIMSIIERKFEIKDVLKVRDVYRFTLQHKRSRMVNTILYLEVASNLEGVYLQTYNQFMKGGN